MRRYDVIVSGTGPAGSCAAIGLRRHGYTVALLERSTFPRPHIGDALTPGVRHMLEFLGVDYVIGRAPTTASSLTLRTWEEPNRVDALPANGTFVTDRAIFDQELRQAAKALGADCFRCGSRVPIFRDEVWHAEIDDTETTCLSARLWIDARGRQPSRCREHVRLGPDAVAMWEEFSVPSTSPRADASRIEALPNAWVWGAPTTTPGIYRVLAVTDPETVRTGSARGQKAWLRSVLSQSTLMAELAELPETGRYGICCASSYAHRTPWRATALKVADAAFAMDPLSSVGVEKAVRHALECTVAAHTVLDGGASAEDVARHYYLTRLAESVAHHASWTARHYREAWASRESFWKSRSTLPHIEHHGEEFEEYLGRQFAVDGPIDSQPQETLMPDNVLRQHLLDGRSRVKLSRLVEFITAVCVVDGKARMAPAVRSPSVPRGTAFLGDIALVPLLTDLQRPTNLNAVVLRWSALMPLRRAMQTLCWLLQNRFLDMCESEALP